LSKDESATAATNYLEDEIRQRVARGAVRFKVVLQLAAPGDKIDDPSVAWASTNKITTLGTLTVASVVAGALARRHRTPGPDDSVPQQDVSGILRAPSSVLTS
jgi:catalase